MALSLVVGQRPEKIQPEKWANFQCKAKDGFCVGKNLGAIWG
jgi:hypothetical protein